MRKYHLIIGYVVTLFERQFMIDRICHLSLENKNHTCVEYLNEDLI